MDKVPFDQMGMDADDFKAYTAGRLLAAVRMNSIAPDGVRRITIPSGTMMKDLEDILTDFQHGLAIKY